MKSRKAIIERWENALRVLQQMTPHERKLHFNMRAWGKKTDCGTVACLAGHCGLDAWFRKRGFRSEFNSAGKLYFPKTFPLVFFNDPDCDDDNDPAYFPAKLFYEYGATHRQMVAKVKKLIRELRTY